MRENCCKIELNDLWVLKCVVIHVNPEFFKNQLPQSLHYRE